MMCDIVWIVVRGYFFIEVFLDSISVLVLLSIVLVMLEVLVWVGCEFLIIELSIWVVIMIGLVFFWVIWMVCFCISGIFLSGSLIFRLF